DRPLLLAPDPATAPAVEALTQTLTAAGHPPTVLPASATAAQVRQATRDFLREHLGRRCTLAEGLHLGWRPAPRGVPGQSDLGAHHIPLLGEVAGARVRRVWPLHQRRLLVGADLLGLPAP